jgi:MarR family transcriptional regulator for hemolysin
MAKLVENFQTVLLETALIWRNKLDKRLKPLGLSQAKWKALLHLSLAKTPMTQTELASCIGIEGPTMAGLLDRLEKAGWIERKDAPHDRRSKTVHLTKKSHKTIDEIYAIAEQLRDELLAPVPEQELKQCMQVLQKIKLKAESL